MKTYRKFSLVLGAALALTALPSSAAPRLQNSGTFTYTDFTPNPTVFGQCSGPEVPSAPVDVNEYEVKVTKKRMTLTTMSHNQLDWAAEIRDSKGNVIATSDQPIGGSQAENFTLSLKKGTYTVYYCNWSGEPQITVDWALK